MMLLIWGWFSASARVVWMPCSVDKNWLMAWRRAGLLSIAIACKGVM